MMDATPPCKDCSGTGWVAVKDPTLGDYVDVRCPERTHRARQTD